MVGQLALNGFVQGALIALMALGMTLIFGILRMINFLHGIAYTVGAIVVFYVITRMGFSYWLALIIAVALVGLVAWGLDKAIFSRLRGNALGGLIATLGLLMVFESSLWLIFGPRPRSLPSQVMGVLKIAGLTVAWERLAVAGISLAAIGALFWLVKYTKLGKSMRAVEQDSEAALVQGINVEYVCGITFGMANGLAALAGGLIAPLFSITPPMGTTPLLLAFVVVILGGMGSIVGALIASFIIGFQQSFTSAFLGADIALAFSGVIALVTLVLRPRGLGGYD